MTKEELLTIFTEYASLKTTTFSRAFAAALQRYDENKI